MVNVSFVELVILGAVFDTDSKYREYLDEREREKSIKTREPGERGENGYEIELKR